MHDPSAPPFESAIYPSRLIATAYRIFRITPSATPKNYIRRKLPPTYTKSPTRFSNVRSKAQEENFKQKTREIKNRSSPQKKAAANRRTHHIAGPRLPDSNPRFR
jgi:hypothetical protein